MFRFVRVCMSVWESEWVIEFTSGTPHVIYRYTIYNIWGTYIYNIWGFSWLQVTGTLVMSLLFLSITCSTHGGEQTYKIFGVPHMGTHHVSYNSVLL